MGWFKKKPQEDPLQMAERLTNQAFEALDAYELEEAAKIASQLREIGFSSWFEIQALVELKRDEPEAAIEVLRQGVDKVPRVWGLWQLLGNTLSDQGQYTEAMQCYETALDLDLVVENRASVEFNRATLLGRMKQFEASLNLAREITQTDGVPDGLVWISRAMTLRALSHLGRVEELQQEAQKLRFDLEGAVNDEAFDNTDSLVSAWAQGGFALLDSGQEWEAQEWATRALAIDRTDREALQLLRYSQPDSPKARQYFKVILQGEVPAGSFEEDEGFAGKDMAFFAPFTVIARSEDEARDLAFKFEALRWDTPLKVESSELEGQCEPLIIGIWQVYGYCFFPLDEDE